MSGSVESILTLAGLIISIITLLVTTYIGVWIADVLQNRSEASKALREYVVNKIIKIQESYELLFLAVAEGDLSADVIKARLNQYSQQLSNILLITQKHYQQKGTDLKKCATLFYEEIEKSQSYRNHYGTDEKAVKFSNIEKKHISTFEKQFEVLFPQLISKIYESHE